MCYLGVFQCYQSHRADVVAVVASADTDQVFSSGVDPDIVKYQLVRVLPRRTLGGPADDGLHTPYGAPVSPAAPVTPAAPDAPAGRRAKGAGGVQCGMTPRVPQRSVYERFVDDGGEWSWTRGETLRHHTHDVKALCIAGDRLISGGVLLDGHSFISRIYWVGESFGHFSWLGQVLDIFLGCNH